MIWQLFNTPSDFGDDWKGYARNVILHTLLVGMAGVFLEPLFPGYGFFIAGGLYAAWELAQWRFRNALPYDCFEDWAFVQSGVLAYISGDIRVIIVAAAFLISGVMRRVK